MSEEKRIGRLEDKVLQHTEKLAAMETELKHVSREVKEIRNDLREIKHLIRQNSESVWKLRVKIASIAGGTATGVITIYELLKKKLGGG